MLNKENRTIRPLYFWGFIFLFLSVSFFVFGTYCNWPYKVESDGKYYYHYLVSMVEDGDLDFTNNYLERAYDWMKVPLDNQSYIKGISPVTGRPVNLFTIGPSILWFPFYLLARLLSGGLELMGIQVDQNLWSRYYQYSVMYSAVIYGMATLLMLYRILRQYFSEHATQVALWTVLLGSPLYYYVVWEPSMSHVYDLFTFVLYITLFWGCVSKNSRWQMVLLGLSGGVHVLVRTQNIVTIGIFSILLVYYMLRYKTPWVNLLFYVGGVIAGLLPLAAGNIYLYGNIFIIPQGASFLHPFDPKIRNLLVSTRNGMFSHHPLLLLGVLGYLGFLYKSIRERNNKMILLVTLLVSFCVQVYINSIANDWWAGHGFGMRRMVSSLPLCFMGVAFISDWASVKFPRLYQRLFIPVIIIVTALCYYLTMIFVFLWYYELPHNIILWMFYYAPLKIMGLYSGA